jgi:hypothetical protein
MATLGKPYLNDSATHPARVGRFPISHAFGQPATTHANAVTPTTRGGAYGVIGEDDFKVTITTGLGWSCAPGRIIAAGTSALAQGAYAGLNDAAVTGTLNARDASNPRITLICYRVRDTDEDATGSEDDAIVMIDGVAASTPADPTLSASLGSLVILSRVTVPSTANGGAPTYSDVRQYATAVGGMRPVTSTTRPTAGGLRRGLPIYELDTNRPLLWNGTAWRGIRPVRYAAGGLALTGTYAGGGTVNTVTVPEQGCDGIVLIWSQAFFASGTAGSVYDAEILKQGFSPGTGSGTARGMVNSLGELDLVLHGEFTKAAGSGSQAYITWITSSSGTSISSTADARGNRITVLFVPDP